MNGFTLLEIMVVVGIIGLLSAVVIGSLNTSRAKARDSQRLSDLKQIQFAIGIYLEEYGVFPTGGGKIGEGTANINTAIDDYLPSVPNDPLTPDSNYYYQYEPSLTCNGKDEVVIYANMEGGNNGNGTIVCTGR